MFNKLYYLGPKGSYTSIAVDIFLKKYLSQKTEKSCEIIAVDSIYNIVKMMSESDSELIVAVLPIENSIEGVVREVQDSLAILAQNGIRILAETSIPIEHSLIGFGNKEKIETLISHPQAFAQCREYIYNNWKNNVTLKTAFSTSNAISTLAPQEANIAAIGNKSCAELYNIPVIETRINDEPNNVTRFILLSKISPSKTEHNKISIVFSTQNEAGALNRVLCVLEKYELNMSYIDSRPSRKELGEYIFYVDFIGHIEDGNVVQALLEIQPLVKMFEVISEGAICI